jgi:hypothetical protein
VKIINRRMGEREEEWERDIYSIQQRQDGGDLAE